MRVRGAWSVIDVAMCEDISLTLSRVLGTAVDSNFLQTNSIVDVKVPISSELVVSGDRIKLVWFTTETELQDFQSGKKSDFVDTGLRCFRLGREGWEILYEDFAFSS